jgi:DNA primase
VVEGYMDVVALAQHGVENAVATLGTATTPFHVAKLLKLADNVVFCFDGDAAGRKAAWRALEIALPVLADGKVVSFLFLPPEDDPDTFVRREGKAAFLEAVGAAKPLSQFLVAELASRVDMGNEEGRARFLAQAKPLVVQIEAPALAAMLRRRLAELARLAPEEIESLIPAKEQARRTGGRPPARVSRRVVALPARLLALVLHAPSLAQSVPELELSEVGPEYGTLRAVIGFFREDPRRTLGQASAYFAGSEHEALMVEAMAEPLLKQAESPDFDLDAELHDIVARMREGRLERRSNQLMQRLVAGTATEAERAEYNDLHTQRATAMSGNPSPEARSKL